MKDFFERKLSYKYFVLLLFIPLGYSSAAQLLYPIADEFHFPVGKNGIATPARDGDGWYDAQPFLVNNHLGEDWNAETGGNSDCGAEVYAASSGICLFSADIEGGWGNVLIIRHLLPNGDWVETLYAHLEDRLKESGDIVGARELLGHIGDGAPPCGNSAPYYAHLHFELRNENCAYFGKVGNGYSEEHKGWLNPTTFIVARRKGKVGR